jgi:glycosyltransferase involved in cell wall biosynthesis
MQFPPMEPGMVSIITTTYNRTHYLKQAIESALKQTYPHFEMIVSDDASTEDVESVVAGFKDPRLRYRRNETNLGMCANICAALQEARGEFFAYLNDDDMWEPTFLEKVVAPMMQNPEITVSFSDHYVMDENGTIDPTLTDALFQQYARNVLLPGLHQPFYKLIVHSTIPCAQASLFRRSILHEKGIPLEVGTCYDRWTGYLACRKGQAAYYTPERLTRYRVHGRSCTSGAGSGSLERALEWNQSFIYYYNELIADPAFHPYRAKLKRQRAIALRVLANTYLAHGQGTRARQYLLRSLQDHPNPKSAVSLGISFMPSLMQQRILQKLRG